MGAQRLSSRKTRRIAEATGLPVVRAWAHGGGHAQDFVTAGHLHGLYDPATGEWEIRGDLTCYTSCPGGSGAAELFPAGPAPLTPAERAAAGQ